MSYRRKKRESETASLIRETIEVTNGRSWKINICLGVFMFVVFYIGVPAYMDTVLQRTEASSAYTAIKYVHARYSGLSEWLGITLALICGFFAARSYLKLKVLNKEDQHRTGILSRILARLLS